MFGTAVISFREFLEAILIISVFLGISSKLRLKREAEIMMAAAVGILISLLIAVATYFFGNTVRGVITQSRAELLESYLLIFSGVFIAYVIFSVHGMLRKARGGNLIKAHQKLANRTFDFSLFLTIIMLVVREGFEIALFTASTSLFTVFIQNVIGLLLGFLSALAAGGISYFTYLKFPMGKVMKWTEYLIIIFGASLFQNGITKLLEHGFNIYLSNFVRFPLTFLPSEESVIGHFLQSLIGIDNEFSLIRLLIMLTYSLVVYFLFVKTKPSKVIIRENREV